MPQELTPEHIECAHEGCKSVFIRLASVRDEISTVEAAKQHGWTVADPTTGALHCAWGHQE